MTHESSFKLNKTIYLDSSPFIRAYNSNSKNKNLYPLITYNKFRQNPDKYIEFMNREFICPSDKQYYVKLLELLESEILSHIITLNPYFFYSEKYTTKILKLFGSASEMYCVLCDKKFPVTTNLVCEGCNNICRPNHIFIDEEVSLKNYGDASKILYNAKTLLIDSSFFTFLCTNSLADYINSSCKKYILRDTATDNVNISGVTVKATPTAFILSL